MHKKKAKKKEVVERKEPKTKSTCLLGNAAYDFAKQMGLPVYAIVFRKYNGKTARSNMTLGALRKDWGV